MNDELMEKDLDNVVGGVPYDAGKEMFENGPAYDPNGPAYDPHQMTENHTDAGAFATSYNQNTQNADSFDNLNMGNVEENPNYLRLIAAQKEAERQVKIANVNYTLTEEHRKRNLARWATAACTVGLLVAGYFNAIDPIEAIKIEIAGLSTFEGLREYLRSITPAEYLGMLGTSAAISQWIKHGSAYKKANAEHASLTDNTPEIFMDVAEHQAKSR